MSNTGKKPRSRLKLGCLVLATGLGVLAVATAITAAVALQQMRSANPQRHQSVQPLPGVAGPTTGPSGAEGEAERTDRPVRVELEVSIAQLVVEPVPAGESIRVEAEYDPRYYELQEETWDSVAQAPEVTWTYRVRFEPVGSTAMALFRVKLGDDPPRLRVSLPRDVPLVLAGELYGSFAALELGGLRLEAVEMDVSGGAVTASFREPLAAPMDHLVLTGDKGSVEVTWLGNASPARAVIEQRFGELDLDLRGPWSRDADIRIDARIAGGTVWLPRDVVVEGRGERSEAPELVTGEGFPKPRLRLSVSERGGRLVWVE